MRITTQGDYALRCLLSIARAGTNKPVAISRIVEQERLPLDYIEQLLMKLRRKKLIKSVRGVKGGYLLDKDPAVISLRDVLEAVEGRTFEIICDKQKKRKSSGCRGMGECSLKVVWVGLKDRIENYLGEITIASLMKKG